MKLVSMCACVCYGCVHVCKGAGITLGLGREHGSGCLIDKPHLESIGENLAGQIRDTQPALTHTHRKQTVGSLRDDGVGWADVSMSSLLHVCRARVEFVTH